MKCPNCDSEKLTWEAGTHHGGGVTDGRLRQNEVSGTFILGCEECSETINMVSADDVANYLNAKGICSFSTEHIAKGDE